MSRIKTDEGDDRDIDQASAKRGTAKNQLSAAAVRMMASAPPKKPRKKPAEKPAPKLAERDGDDGEPEGLDPEIN